MGRIKIKNLVCFYDKTGYRGRENNYQNRMFNLSEYEWKRQAVFLMANFGVRQ